jgi:hypothetical protein
MPAIARISCLEPDILQFVSIVDSRVPRDAIAKAQSKITHTAYPDSRISLFPDPYTINSSILFVVPA